MLDKHLEQSGFLKHGQSLCFPRCLVLYEPQQEALLVQTDGVLRLCKHTNHVGLYLHTERGRVIRLQVVTGDACGHAS